MKVITATIATVLLLAGVAGAVTDGTAKNTYAVTGKVTPAKAGSKKKPVAVSLATSSTTTEASGQRPAVVSRYSSSTTGIRVNGKAFPTCEASRIEAAGSDTGCPKGSQIGKSTAVVKSGVTENQADQTYTCNLTIRLFNAKHNHVAIHLLADPSACDGNAVNNVIDGKWTVTSKKATFTYTTPSAQSHSVADISSATVATTTVYKKVTRKYKGKKVGYLEAIGCKKGKRITIGTFTTEGGQVASARASQKC